MKLPPTPILALCLLLSAATKLFGETVHMPPGVDAEYPIIVDGRNDVLFKVTADRKIISCTGKFTNTDGSFDGPFSFSTRVKFGAAAEGLSSPCTIKVVLQGANGQLPETQTTLFHVIVPTFRSRTLAHVPGSSDDRHSLGVGEEVMMTAEPKHALLDSDVTWHTAQPWNTLTNRTGITTIYAAGFPHPGAGTRQEVGEAKKKGESPGEVYTSFRVATNEFTLQFGHPRRGRGHARSKSEGLYDEFAHQHSPTALAAAYKGRLDQIDAELTAHRWSFEPALVTAETPLRFFVRSPGFKAALRAVAALQCRSPEDGTGEQSADLRTREIQLVARIVSASNQVLDPTVDLGETPTPQDIDVKLPAGARLKPNTPGIIFGGPFPPDAILQPDLRRQYKEAIAANNAKIASHNKQMEASFYDETMRRFAMTYIRELCGRTDPRLSEFMQALLALGLDKHAVREIVKKPKD